MKIFAPIISLLFITNSLFAQSINQQDYKFLQSSEDSLKIYAQKIITGPNLATRFSSDSIFTRMFVRSLKTPYSFFYTFDSLLTISQLYAPDSSFKIFTWQMEIDAGRVRQHGAIQMRTKDGSLKLFPLIDKSSNTENVQDTIGNNLGWMGAVYYRIIQKKYLNRNYYTLLGFDEYSIAADRKLIEVLHFENGEPVFGGPFFSVPNDKLIAKNPARYIMEFKAEAGPKLNYDPELDMIIMEHLVSENNQPNKKYTLVGDGDYEGFRWINGRWVYLSKIFNEVTPEGQAPVPKPYNEGHGEFKPKQ